MSQTPKLAGEINSNDFVVSNFVVGAQNRRHGIAGGLCPFLVAVDGIEIPQLVAFESAGQGHGTDSTAEFQNQRRSALSDRAVEKPKVSVIGCESPTRAFGRKFQNRFNYAVLLKLASSVHPSGFGNLRQEISETIVSKIVQNSNKFHGSFFLTERRHAPSAIDLTTSSPRPVPTALLAVVKNGSKCDALRTKPVQRIEQVRKAADLSFGSQELSSGYSGGRAGDSPFIIGI